MSSNSTAIGGSRDILTSSHGFCSALLGDRTIEELFAEAPGRRYGERESGDVRDRRFARNLFLEPLSCSASNVTERSISILNDMRGTLTSSQEFDWVNYY
jgi:hypothetical protein